MRRRPALLPALALIAAAALAALAWGSQRHRAPPPVMDPPAGMSPFPGPPALDPGDPLAGPMADLLPMHRAVQLATRRFDGKPLDIALVAPTAEDSAAGAVLVYRLRMLTRSRDVVEIRMDALDGRFLELRGADLGKVRRAPKPGPKPGRKDD